MMDKNLLVMIESSPTSAGSKSVATGYPVAKDLILTARHVLFNGATKHQKIEVFWPHRPDCAQNSYTGTCVWDGGLDYDVALIQSTFPETVRGPFGIVSGKILADHWKWESEGFAQAGKDKNGKYKSVPMKGEVYSSADDMVDFVIEEDAPPQNITAWQGISGSPVFVHGVIVGVIYFGPTPFVGRRLKAVSLAKIRQECPKFCELIDDDKKNEHREDVTREVEKILSNSSASEIVKSLGKEMRKDASIDDLIKWLLDKGPGVFPIFKDLYRKLKKINNINEMANLRSIVQWTVPLLSDYGQMISGNGASPSSGMLFKDAPIATKTMAEVAMAGHDGRNADYRLPCNNRWPEGRLHLPFCPEGGTCENMDVQSFTKHMLNEFSIPEDIRTSDGQYVIDEINGFLNHKSEEGETFYFTYNSLVKDDVITEIAKKFHSVVFIMRKSGALHVSENKEFYWYFDIIFAQSKG